MLIVLAALFRTYYNKIMDTIKTAPPGLVLCSARELDISKTFDCGQCFRWTADGSGGYTGVAFGRLRRIWTEDGQVCLDAPETELPLWQRYFDLDTDYDRAAGQFCCNAYMEACVNYGRGIRILRQERWEALCSFIISQCNNIPRIRCILEKLCSCFGEPLDETHFSFPTAGRVAALTVEELSVLRAGYRAPYILEAARAVDSGALNFDALEAMDCAGAMQQLRRVRGVGEKVANCFILFGLHKMEAFPVDVWMKRALREHFPQDFDPTVFGSCAGLAQQYIFYYARSGEQQ